MYCIRIRKKEKRKGEKSKDISDDGLPPPPVASLRLLVMSLTVWSGRPEGKVEEEELLLEDGLEDNVPRHAEYEKLAEDTQRMEDFSHHRPEKEDETSEQFSVPC